MQVIVQEGELNVDSSPLAMYNFFVERIRQNLHVILTMSPIGDAFRNRLRKFPSLINCCTIDWFQVRYLFQNNNNNNNNDNYYYYYYYNNNYNKIVLT